MARGAWASKNNSSSVQFVTWKSNEINTLCGSPEVRTFLELERFGAWRQVVVSESWVEWFPIQRNPGFWISKGFLRGRHCRSLVEAGAVRSRFLQSQERTWKTRKTLLIYFQALHRCRGNITMIWFSPPSLHLSIPLALSLTREGHLQSNPTATWCVPEWVQKSGAQESCAPVPFVQTWYL